jgi:RNA-directed DNA polymerase
MQTSLQGIAQKAKTDKKHRFRNLYGALNEEYLHKCWRDIRMEAAYGVDRISAEEYGRNLVANIRDLVQRLKEKRYRAKFVLRKYIPKEGGKMRPLGIPAVEDKLLQLAVARLLEAIFEHDFLECSYGYRPKRSPLQASEQLITWTQFGGFNWIVEADIKGYFDSIDHEWLIKMVEQRVDDQAFTRLIRKWLRAGILEKDGKIIHPVTGTPQGGIVSPILANIYLHYALDLWFEKVVKPKLQRGAFLIRYADDFVCGFERESEAKQFEATLKARLAKFGLGVSEEKTRTLSFKRSEKSGRFDFLGFEYSWGKSRKGTPRVKRRTARKKLRASIKRFSVWCKENRHKGVKNLIAELNLKLRSYYTHYGVIGNYESLNQFYTQVERALYRWLNKRSQRRSVTWKSLKRLLKKHQLLKPFITQKRLPKQLLLS